MKASLQKVTLSLTVIIVIIITAFLAGPYFLTHLIRKRILHVIENYRTEGIDIRYDSLQVLRQRITFYRLQVSLPSADHNCLNRKSSAQIKSVEITGLKILPIILNHSLQLDSIIVTQPEIYHHRPAAAGHHKKEKRRLNNIFIGHIIFKNAKLGFIDSALCKSSVLVTFSGNLAGLSIENLNHRSARWQFRHSRIISPEISLPFHFYRFKINEIVFNADEKKFEIDSIQIIPTSDKQTFAQKYGHQTDRIEGHIPFLKANGVSVNMSENPGIHAQIVNLGINLDVFRDKRYPFHHQFKSLPVKYLSKLPFHIDVDSVHLVNSYVAYEEMQEDGNVPGKIFFDKLDCKIYNISNRGDKKTIMQATALFMDNGRLNARFTFPSSPEKHYHVRGTLSDFHLPRVNSMLIPAAHAKISAGVLEEMHFDFSYDNDHAEGTLKLNYRDLKMESLLKETKKTNKLLTFLLRLVIREDMDENLPTDKKTGSILFYRDKERSIFNYWWKSILSGIKSVYNLDKITNSEGKK